MHGMCCGCCSLSTGTTIALIFCSIQAVFGITWSTELLMLLNESEIYNPLRFVMNEHTLEDFDVIHGLTLATIGLNGFWLIFAVIAARGNITLNHGQLALWDVFTYLITLFDLGATIYFAVKVQCSVIEDPELFIQSKPSKTFTYIILLAGFSKGGIVMFLNIYFAHIVQMRGKEINHDHSVLALYVISHLARCNRNIDTAPLIPGPPPTYASSVPLYASPCQRSAPRTSSGDSSWSLSYDAIRGMSHEPTSFEYLNPSLDLARKLSENLASSCDRQTDVHVDTGLASLPL